MRTGVRQAAVLGSPIGHSLSPVLHTAAYQAMGIADRWSYVAQECTEPELAHWLDSRDESWAGVSLTMPLKRHAMSLVDWCDPVGREVGGINTVVFTSAGRRGYNTDVSGIVAAIRSVGVRSVRSVTVLGAGATAASTIVAMRTLGVEDPVTVLARDLTRTDAPRAAGERAGVPVRFAPLTDIADHLDVDLVVSTLPAGGADAIAPIVADSPAAVFDVAYGAEPTTLVRAVTSRGRPAAEGFTMLLHQACAQVELMTGLPAPLDAMRRAGEATLRREDPTSHGTARGR
ncbi:shikimate dehydrogenase [Spiractinospora alimapuensis]|nr:shikimate dehydrogenase [Spiractinospora alimapuensis]